MIMMLNVLVSLEPIDQTTFQLASRRDLAWKLKALSRVKGSKISNSNPNVGRKQVHVSIKQGVPFTIGKLLHTPSGMKHAS